MKKGTLYLLIALAISTTMTSQIFAETNSKTNVIKNKTAITALSDNIISDNTDITSKFTDANFKAKVYSLIGKSSSSAILYGDVNKITSLDVKASGISDLSGIEYFTSLDYLNCSNNNLTRLDISKNTKLNCLDCTNNKLTTLDVSKSPLNVLLCAYNEVTKLYVQAVPSSNVYNPQYKDSEHTMITFGLNEQVVGITK